MSSLLSIKEAARLMGVCENTLRDWDDNGTFKASRTAGGHRRYTIASVREYLDRHPAPTEEKDTSHEFKPTMPDDLVAKWDKTGHLDDFEIKDKRNLAVLLENLHRTHAKDDFCLSKCFMTKAQQFWLTRQVWRGLRFKRLVSVQPMLGPCGLAFYFKRKKQSLYIDSSAVAATSGKYSFTFFPDADFEAMKDSYVRAMIHDIDSEIFKQLCKVKGVEANKLTPEDIQDADYIIGHQEFIDGLTGKVENKDLLVADVYLHPKNYAPLVVAGNYPNSFMTTPIFMPYLLLGGISPLKYPCGWSRTGWYLGKKERKQRPQSRPSRSVKQVTVE